MQFDNFEIHASPFITKAYCTNKKCRQETLIEVMNGWFSKAMYCPKCKSVYTVKLVKVPDKKVSKEFLKQCKQTVDRIEAEKRESEQ